MKKMFAVGATAALMLAATSPAFASHTLAINEGDDTEFNAVAQNISGGFGDVEQSQFGEATADASGDSAAAAAVSQSQGFTFVQFNSALNDF